MFGKFIGFQNQDSIRTLQQKYDQKDCDFENHLLFKFKVRQTILIRGRLLKVTCLDCGEHSHVENDEKKHWEETEKSEPKVIFLKSSGRRLWIALVGGSLVSFQRNCHLVRFW